jgi:hypothetical protein
VPIPIDENLKKKLNSYNSFSTPKDTAAVIFKTENIKKNLNDHLPKK